MVKNLSNTKILITGACGVTSRSVVRSLKKSSIFNNVRIIGTDICENPYGLYEGLYDRIYRVPFCSNPGYHNIMTSICAEEKIDAAIIIPELEVLYWCKNKIPVKTLLPPPLFAQNVINKFNLYQVLSQTNLIPKFSIFSKKEVISANTNHSATSFPIWLRDYQEGSTSGRAAFCAKTQEEILAWMTLNPSIESFLASEFLPGKNLACFLLYDAGQLIKVCCYERLEYFMAKTVMSGISGNICKGKLINHSLAVTVSIQAIENICQQTNEIMNGLIAVDLREDIDGFPKITEINLRPVAGVSAFAEVHQANIIEAYTLRIFGLSDLTEPIEVIFPPNNRIFRDIDGVPIFIHDYQPLKIGEYHDNY